MTQIRQWASDRLLHAGVETSIDRHEMTQRAASRRRTIDPLTDDGKILLLTGWVSRAQLWLARKVRPTTRRRVW